jgi:hypothetical protein
LREIRMSALGRLGPRCQLDREEEEEAMSTW